MGKATARFQYELSSKPAQLPVSSSATVHVTLDNASKAPVTCKKLTFTLTVGEGADAFTAQADAANIQVVVPQKGWSRQSNTDAHVFVMEPSRKVQEIQPGKLTFSLTGVKVNAVPGKARMDVTEELKDTESATIQRYHTKFKGGFALYGLLPKSPSVDAGKNAVLTWSRDNRTNEVIKLHWSEGPADGVDVSNQKSWEGLVWRDIAFRLTADQNGVTHVLNTYVTVREPHLVVNKLTVNGACALWQRPKEGVMPQLTPPPGQLGSTTRTYTANSDGVLVGSVQTFRPTAKAELSVVVRPPAGLTHDARIRAAGDRTDVYDQGPQLAVPVPCDSTVTVTWDLRDTGSGLSPHRTIVPTLNWHPWGNGSLT